MAERHEDRKVVRAEARQDLHRDQPEVIRVEAVVERETQPRPPCVERVEEATPDARVEQAADLLEESAGVRPRDVVEVAHHDRRRLRRLGLARDDQELCVALRRSRVFGREGRARVQAVQLHGRAVVQFQAGVDRGNVVFDDEPDFRLDQLQAHIEQHSIGIVERPMHRVGMRSLELAQLRLPPGIGFHDQDHVRVGPADDRAQGFRAAVVHQHVGEEQPAARSAGRATAVLDLFGSQRRVGGDHVALEKQAHAQTGREGPSHWTCSADQQLRRQREGEQDGELQAREVEDPDPPGAHTQQREHGGGDRHAADRHE